ncbi:hypothetical protein PPL_09050 [Heterostelium album PN500]|uniref:Uncharacterized protein n=1 Tax=Heterostelium pallidum (strain ATCC 26659 / Pp 5 / PN500) TaxID=670386 RepID=D3BKG9_HETP5|nr:hypothetical protein PPL_09050 [Heterostelium album PN500]EFA78399.1 hypothetical protein PPL_09050 [Heterostelium album PN500]|eukprot:XP_020430524.1 hypothetical protein PPL_09050 [Heterostelium album PN500]
MSTTASIRNKKLIAIEADIEKARSDKDFASLLSLLKKYSKITSSNNEILECLVNAERYIADENYHDAQIMLDRASLLKPDDQEVIAYLGYVDYNRNDTKKALEDLSRLVNPYTNTNNEMILNYRKINILLQAFNIKGKCQESQGQSEQALQSYENVIDIAFRYFKSFRAIDVYTRPFVIDAFIHSAMIHRYFGNIGEAVKILRNCLSSQIILTASSYRYALLTLGELLLRNTTDRSYIPVLDAAGEQQIRPGHFFIPADQVEESLLTLLHVEQLQHSQLQQNPQSSIITDQDISLTSKFTEVHRWTQLALSLYCAGKYKRSLFIIEECLALTPNNIDLILLGSKICINQLNQFSKGIMLAKQAIGHLDSTVGDSVQLANAYLLIGVAYERRALESVQLESALAAALLEQGIRARVPRLQARALSVADQHRAAPHQSEARDCVGRRFSSSDNLQVGDVTPLQPHTDIGRRLGRDRVGAAQPSPVGRTVLHRVVRYSLGDNRRPKVVASLRDYVVGRCRRRSSQLAGFARNPQGARHHLQPIKLDRSRNKPSRSTLASNSRGIHSTTDV